MSAKQLIKIQTAKASDICRRAAIAADHTQAIADDVTPSAFLEDLLAREAFVDAIRFLAYALPKREATWWACLCARSVLPKDVDPQTAAGLQAAEAWVYKPTEENRQAALKAAEAVRPGTAVSWAALAAGWSGRSLAAPNKPVIAPGEDLTPAAVAGAVIEAAVTGGGDIQGWFRQFLGQGIDIASGGTGRPKAKSA